MKQTLSAFVVLAGLACAALADGTFDPVKVEQSFDGARVKDELSGVLGDPAKETRIRLFVSAGSSLSVTLSSTPDDGVAIPGMTLTLCDDAGVDQMVTGGAFDKSVPDSGVIVWKKVPLATYGGYSLILRGTGEGVWHMTLGGAVAKTSKTTKSTEGLGVNVEAEVDVPGLEGSTLSFSLAAANGSKFKGELLRVERPDGSMVLGTSASSSGKVHLDTDGVHKLVFTNVGNGLGAWSAKTTVTPRTAAKRRGYVRPEGTAFVPSVTSVSPSSDFNKDDMARVTLTGKNFQPGMDVRLVRKGYEDIVATAVLVDSDTSVRCLLNLDTNAVTGKTSVGQWNVGVWNAPVYAVPGDPKTLVKDSPTSHMKKTFECLNSGSIKLPSGVVKETEVWHLAFNDDFQTDLDRIGLGSIDPDVRRHAREAVQAYVVCFLRDLMEQNETTGKLAKSMSGAVSFVVDEVPSVAGRAGEDYNRIEIGGAWQPGDEHAPTEPLFWGFAPLDPGNTHRDDLSIEIDNGIGGTTRVGHGVRLRVLDPGGSAAHPEWVAQTFPLKQSPLVAFDVRYFSPNFLPRTVNDANRYKDIVTFITRASREIAAIVAHHIGRAMGLAPGGSGPMQNPDLAGNLWPTTGALDFTSEDLTKLRIGAVPHALPGSSNPLTVTYFPLISTQPAFMPNATTAIPYSVSWNYVGGRANAKPGDFILRTSGNPPLDMTVNYLGISGTPRLYIDASQGLFYCNIQYFRVALLDTLRGGAVQFSYRLNILPNIPLLRPGNEQIQATNCRNTILATP